MLEKLRRKFILIIMIMVTVTLVIMSGVILTINYGQNQTALKAAAQYSTSDTAFQHHDGGIQGDANAAPPVDGTQGDATDQPSTATDGSAQASTSSDQSSVDNAQQAVDVGKGDMGKGGGLATSCYLVAADGTVTSTLSNALELETTTQNEAIAYALSQYDDGAADGITGRIGDLGLYYSIRQTPSGIKVAFASESYLINGVTSLAEVLALVCACVWLAFFGISVFLARAVLRPTERAWKQQQQFVADASHELKTPLSVIMANNSILLSHEDETIASQRRWVESSQSEAHQMLDLVKDMLILAEPENQKRQTIAEKVNLSDLVEGDVLQFESICFEKQIELGDSVERGIMVRGDKSRLQRLVSILMDNACKYADKGGNVRVELARHGTKAVFSVHNDGAIIPSEDIDHIFDRFYRVDKARVRSEGGFGLGLAMAKEVADEHHGTIEVTSDEQKGTLFMVMLPVERA